MCAVCVTFFVSQCDTIICMFLHWGRKSTRARACEFRHSCRPDQFQLEMISDSDTWKWDANNLSLLSFKIHKNQINFNLIDSVGIHSKQSDDNDTTATKREGVEKCVHCVCVSTLYVLFWAEKGQMQHTHKMPTTTSCEFKDQLNW